MELFSSFLYPAVDDEARLYSDLAQAYSKVTQLGQVLADLKFPMQVNMLMEQVRSGLLTEDGGPVPADQVFDPELHEFIGRLLKEEDVFSSKSRVRTNMILSHLLDYLERLTAWISGAYDVADDDLAHEVVKATHRAFALYSGTHLAYLYLTLASSGRIEQFLARLDQTLLSGV